MFKKATRTKSPLKIMITGVAGAGKTVSAIRMGNGMASNRSRLAVVDSAYGGASIYGERYDFDIATTTAEPRSILACLKAAIDAGYKTLVWDGANAEWERIKQEIGKQPDGYGIWERTRVAMGHEDLLTFIVECPVDLIVTVACEERYEVSVDPATGKTTMARLGALPNQCKEFKGLFDLVFSLDAQTHEASLKEKNRTDLWQDNVPFLITEEHGELLTQWRDTGADFIMPITSKTRDLISRALNALGYSKPEDMIEKVKDCGYDIPNIKMLSEEDGIALFNKLKLEYRTVKEAQNAKK